MIIAKIKRGEWAEILDKLCSMKNDYIVIEYSYFKYIATKETYDIIISIICNNIENLLKQYSTFSVLLNLKMLTMVDIDKHKHFIQYVSNYLKEKYPDKMTKCYIYNPPFVFSQLFNIICMFIDKETQRKIVVL
jgi:Fe-S cluster biosynthesis and repair protein YggX